MAIIIRIKMLQEKQKNYLGAQKVRIIISEKIKSDPELRMPMSRSLFNG
jgi:hypothetical protein